MECEITKMIRVYGIVQGVGFRPTVSRHAMARGIRGSVSNKGPYVEIFAQGRQQDVDGFIGDIENRPPKRAAILKLLVEPVEEPEEAFARRNFGNDHGKLYKPDYRSLNAENADVALQYIDDNPDSYPGIFENAKFKVSKADQERVIEALKTLSTGENLETAVNVDEVLRYFTVQVFVMNWDSYLGHTGHNYFLYEENGILSILPWDYNLAFGTYALGMTNPIKDPNILINYPINTPAEGEVMLNRPLYHNLMKHDEYFTRYHDYFDEFLSEYFESGQFAVTLRQTEKLIAPYVQKDPTAFCSYEDHRLAVDTLEQVCLLRAENIRGQLDGEISATIRGQMENPDAKIDASGVRLTDLGDFKDLEESKERQDAALRDITGKST